jgi:NADH:ubiquinone oxidoreductase subunit 2 (subunit N)
MVLQNEQPLLAATTTIFLLSLAGIPLTAGFLSKFYMLKAAMAAGKNFMAGNFCSTDGGSECVLLFPGYPGYVF